MFSFLIFQSCYFLFIMYMYVTPPTCTSSSLSPFATMLPSHFGYHLFHAFSICFSFLNDYHAPNTLCNCSVLIFMPEFSGTFINFIPVNSNTPTALHNYCGPNLFCKSSQLTCVYFGFTLIHLSVSFHQSSCCLSIDIWYSVSLLINLHVTIRACALLYYRLLSANLPYIHDVWYRTYLIQCAQCKPSFS